MSTSWPTDAGTSRKCFSLFTINAPLPQAHKSRPSWSKTSSASPFSLRTTGLSYDLNCEQSISNGRMWEEVLLIQTQTPLYPHCNNFSNIKQFSRLKLWHFGKCLFVSQNSTLIFRMWQPPGQTPQKIDSKQSGVRDKKHFQLSNHVDKSSVEPGTVIMREGYGWQWWHSLCNAIRLPLHEYKAVLPSLVIGCHPAALISSLCFLVWWGLVPHLDSQATQIFSHAKHKYDIFALFFPRFLDLH